MSAPSVSKLHRREAELTRELESVRAQIEKEEAKQARQQSTDCITVNGKAIRVYVSQRSTIETDPAIDCTEYKPVKRSEAAGILATCQQAGCVRIAIRAVGHPDVPEKVCELSREGESEFAAQVGPWRLTFKEGDHTLTFRDATLEIQEEDAVVLEEDDDDLE